MKKLIKPLCLLTGLLCAPAVLLHAQVDEKLKADIVSTGYVHSPLPLDERNIRLEKESVGNCDAV